MTAFPRQPVAPAELFEGYLGARMASLRLPADMAALELSLGVKLTGEEGGEWVLSFSGGGARLRAGRRSAAPLSLIQSVRDFRGALWEARGEGLRRRLWERLPLLLLSGESQAGSLDPARLQRAVEELAGLDALVRLCLGDEAGGEWCLDLRLGPGALPAEPCATVSLPLDAAEALATGRLGFLDALLRIQVEGDYALLFQAFAALKSAGA